MILLSELSRRRIRSIQKLIRVGRNEVVVVMRVDKEKGEPIFFPSGFGSRIGARTLGAREPGFFPARRVTERGERRARWQVMIMGLDGIEGS